MLHKRSDEQREAVFISLPWKNVREDSAMKHSDHRCERFTIVLGFILSFAAPVWAQGIDIEPNNACTNAQDLGEITFPSFVLNGSLDTPPEIPDVDFFRFTAQPGAPIRVDHEGQATNSGTLPDPFLGLFDSACRLLDVNDDTQSLNSRLIFTVPADGIFVLAASSCCDFEFLGQGISSGTYQVTITAPSFIDSIRGRIIDAITGLPLRGDVPPFGFVELLRCTNGDCFQVVNAQSTDNAGRFEFVQDFAGQPLEVGEYQVQAFAIDYDLGRTDSYNVSEGEALDTGDIPLQPPPVQFSEIRPCGDLPPEGGRCRYSVRITNHGGSPFGGMAWSLVDSNDTGSRLGYSIFQAGPPVRIAPGRSRVAHFQFYVPNTVRDGAFICVRVFFGQGRDEFFDTLGQRNLFCVEKGFGAFSIMEDKEAQALFRHQRTSRQLRSVTKK